MKPNTDIGTKVKQLRTERSYTLKQFSEATGLSVGFLSQFERGLSSIAIDSLEKIAQILGVDLSFFFQKEETQPNHPVVHSFDLRPNEISTHIYQYLLSKNTMDFQLLPRIFLLLPFANVNDEPEMYCHVGEEFIYVLEGIVTMYLENAEYALYPGDSIQVHSGQRHNWRNKTNQNARILTVNFPNPFQQGAGSQSER